MPLSAPISRKLSESLSPSDESSAACIQQIDVRGRRSGLSRSHSQRRDLILRVSSQWIFHPPVRPKLRPEGCPILPLQNGISALICSSRCQHDSPGSHHLSPEQGHYSIQLPSTPSIESFPPSRPRCLDLMSVLQRCTRAQCGQRQECPPTHSLPGHELSWHNSCSALVLF